MSVRPYLSVPCVALLAALGAFASVFLTARPQLPTVVLIGAGAVSDSVRLISTPMPSGPLQFPPQGKAYRDNAESHRLWRWIALQSPDLVLVAGKDPDGLVDALNAAGTSARHVSMTEPLSGIGTVQSTHQSMEQRVARSPAEVARALEPYYGHEFKEPVYIPAMALIARLRLGEFDDVSRIARPFLDGRDSLANATASNLPGHLLFAELAEHSSDPSWLRLARRAADLGFNADGSMKESMPMHNEMSDSVFMGCPILAKVGKLSKEEKYFDMAARHFRFMAALDRRADGLWRHSPLNQAAWGRGNAFAALGLALTLADFPKSNAAYRDLLSSYRELVSALAKRQDPVTGMWHQVIDHPESYGEFSATAMIGRAMLIGVRNGWIDAEAYRPRVDAAWNAVSSRVFQDGTVMDVCESTGKLKTLQEYLDREAIWGHDPRGGGMALIFAVERMQAAR